MKKASMYLAACMTIFFLAGCMNNNNDETADQADNNATEHETHNEQTTNDEGNNEARLSVLDKAEGSLEDIDKVEDATVLAAGERAYAAVQLENGTQVTDELKKDMEDKVKKSDTTLEEVYISEDPDFTTQMKDYAERIEAGEPVEGLVDEFSDTVRRVFPSE
ncbi:YhcN/YlaJ family sporulation lipoprotein [Domibacillus indicus]|uniref:YhcN/YlaJ family sporulation lipoprotein n=1 Tax=Domibacillus indicus TaxID=1437523 RepID=UPI0020409800|nr:YhcN/YlaJ family sporulation lipoprotein [Domibacillus indicus]MCM3790775.1 YhcN/YlaJ family sporulation lipoprotein [Domibacillus indicus]